VADLVELTATPPLVPKDGLDRFQLAVIADGGRSRVRVEMLDVARGNSRLLQGRFASPA